MTVENVTETPPAYIAEPARRIIERVADAVGTMAREGDASFTAGCEAIMRETFPLFTQLGMTETDEGLGFDEDQFDDAPQAPEAIARWMREAMRFIDLCDADPCGFVDADPGLHEVAEELTLSGYRLFGIDPESEQASIAGLEHADLQLSDLTPIPSTGNSGSTPA